jgi:aminoglycoside phosphotransferase (APT) family kinase protein
VLTREQPSNLRFGDICHGDFHHRNLLTDGDTVTGIFDWEGAGCGDWRFDVATLAFWCTVAAHQVEAEAVTLTRRRAEQVCDQALLAYFTAALATRVLTFYLTAHPDYVPLFAPAIEERVMPWWHSA